LKQTIEIPCSWSQKELVLDHLLHGEELGVLESERLYLIERLNKEQKPGTRVKILHANLVVDKFVWLIEFESKNEN